ncbi:hypothetical protein [Bacillus altitudinis]|uniref:hypothetical protein n=1 Tax=Bacillus altitudinis TaxID=293387 RepID=UPI0020C41311|nr:hypothetical protein [Bacillus altitudinis]
MDINEILKGLKEYYKIPSIVVTLIIVFSAIRPISFISAGIVEKKFFSKEKLFFFNAVKHIFHTLLWTIILYTGATFILIKINEDAKVSILILGQFIWLLIQSTFTNKESKISRIITSNKWLKCIVVILFFACFLCFYLAFYNMVLAIDNGGTFKEVLVIGLILFIITLPVPSIMKPIFKCIKWYTDRVLYWEDKEKNKWYLIHLIDKNSFLVGDHKDYILCKKTKLLKKEDLYGKTFHIE